MYRKYNCSSSSSRSNDSQDVATCKLGALTIYTKKTQLDNITGINYMYMYMYMYRTGQVKIEC